MRLAFITNNAPRPPGQVAQHLQGAGVEATDDVVTSSPGCPPARLERFGRGLVRGRAGADGLREALAAGLTPVEVQDEAVAVATGCSPDVRTGAR